MIGRGDIVTALNDAGIDGLEATVVRPDTAVAGNAWVELVESVPLGVCTNEDEWLVKVVLPSGHLEASVDVLDSLRYDVQLALAKIGEVRSLRPDQVTVAEASLPALFVTLVTS